MTIYTASHVVPVSSRPIRDGAVVVKNGVIQAIGLSKDIIGSFPGEKVRDFGNSAIVPGFVNCHAHLELTAFRGQLDHFDSDFCSWLREITLLRRERGSEKEIKLSALLGASEAAVSGVTTIGDIGRLGYAGVNAMRAAGLRGVVFQETEFSPADGTANNDFEILREKYESLAENCGDLVSVGISPHAPFTVSRALFEKIARYAIDNGVLLSIHAAESQAEMELMQTGKGAFYEAFFKDTVEWNMPGMRTIEFFNEIGVLEAAPLLAHCVRVTQAEIEMIAASGTRIAHCPKSNSKFGHGVAPMAEFLRHNITVGIGSDSMASNNTCDLLEETRFAGLASRVNAGDDEFVSAEELFRLITIGGAEALGIDDVVGSLEAGKQADIAVISLSSIGQQPLNDIYSALVFSTSASSVSSVMVAGNLVCEDGKLKTIDQEELLSEVDTTFAC